MKLNNGKVNRIFTKEFEHDTQLKRTADLTQSDKKDFCNICEKWKIVNADKLCKVCFARKQQFTS